jgi:hypothetical protein
MTSSTPPPRTVRRRIERWMMGVVMGVAAFFVEKLVLRSLRRSGGSTKVDDGTAMQSRGASIEG